MWRRSAPWRFMEVDTSVRLAAREMAKSAEAARLLATATTTTQGATTVKKATTPDNYRPRWWSSSETNATGGAFSVTAAAALTAEARQRGYDNPYWVRAGDVGSCWRLPEEADTAAAPLLTARKGGGVSIAVGVVATLYPVWALSVADSRRLLQRYPLPRKYFVFGPVAAGQPLGSVVCAQSLRFAPSTDSPTSVLLLPRPTFLGGALTWQMANATATQRPLLERYYRDVVLPAIAGSSVPTAAAAPLPSAGTPPSPPASLQQRWVLCDAARSPHTGRGSAEGSAAAAPWLNVWVSQEAVTELELSLLTATTASPQGASGHGDGSYFGPEVVHDGRVETFYNVAQLQRIA